MKTFMLPKRNQEINPEITQCEQQLEQIEQQKRECYLDIGRLYAQRAAAKEETGTPYEKLLIELDRLEADKELLEKRKLAIQNLRKCEKCGNILSLDSVFCNKCGEKLEEITPEVLSSVPLCPNCKAPIEEGGTFCIHCGAKLEQTVPKIMPTVSLCPSCKAPIEEGSTFCMNCGASIGEKS